jgi:hypothetical protein
VLASSVTFTDHTEKCIGGRTLYVNACLCNEAYDPVNPPRVIDLDAPPFI